VLRSPLIWRITVKIAMAALFFLSGSFCLGQSSSLLVTDTPKKCPVPVITNKIPTEKIQAPSNTADLNSVIVSVEAALKCYQDNVGVGPDALPKLQKAELDFKTTTGKIGGLSVSIFVFAIKGSKENDVTNEITFTYALKTKEPSGGHALLRKIPPQPLADAIVADLQAAAGAVKESSKLSNLPFNQLKVVLTFGVVLDGSASVNVPVHLVTLGGGGEYKKNEAQTVTLTFAPPDSK